jgi:hypothetical protein
MAPSTTKPVEMRLFYSGADTPQIVILEGEACFRRIGRPKAFKFFFGT